MHRLPIILLAVLLVSTALSPVSAKRDWDTEARANKADYIFLEGMSAYSEGELDKYVTFVDRAFAADTADVDISGEWAFLQFVSEDVDSATMARSYYYLKRRYLADPSNIVTGSLFANMAQRLKRFPDAVETWEMLDSANPSRSDVALELARMYLRSFSAGDSLAFDKAMNIYNRMEAGSGRSVDLANQKLSAFYMKGDTSAVVSELDSLYMGAPHDSYTALFIGAHYQYLDKSDEAIRFYDLACELDSTNGSAYLARARFYNAKGDSVAFDREVFHALKSQNLDFDSKLEILRSYVSELYTDDKQEPRIVELFNTLQQQHSGESQVHNLYGAYLYERKDYKGAAEQFSYSVDLDPAEESTWMSLVQNSAMASDSAMAIKYATEAITRFPENFYFPIVASNVYRMAGDDSMAIKVIEAVDLSNVKNVRAAANLVTTKGDIYASAGDTIMALKAYDEAIGYDPSNAMALNNAAYFMAISGGDLDKAESYSARSLENDALNPTYLDTYAWVFFCKKDYSMAKHYIDVALNSVAEMPDSAAIMADVVDDADMAEVDTENEAIEEVVEVEEAIEADALSADIYDHAGDIYFMNGEKDEAIKFWQKAHEIDPENKLIARKLELKTILLK